MSEVNLLRALPVSKRNVTSRATAKTPEHIRIAREFGELYFDGPREYGYGGYQYDGRWKPVAEDIISHFGLARGDRVLDIGCAKGFWCVISSTWASIHTALISRSTQYQVGHRKPMVA